MESALAAKRVLSGPSAIKMQGIFGILVTGANIERTMAR